MRIMRQILLATAVLFFWGTVIVAALASGSDVPFDDNNAIVGDPHMIPPPHDPFKSDWIQKSLNWKGEATIEVYMESHQLNGAGNLTGPDLYRFVWGALARVCPDDLSFCFSIRKYVDTKRVKDNRGSVQPSRNIINVHRASYHGKQVRNLLIGTIAGVYEAATTMARNCYYADDPSTDYRYCNVPVRVAAFTEDSYMDVIIYSESLDSSVGSWRCCETREAMDAAIDGLLSEFKEMYPKPRSMLRNVECFDKCENWQTESNINVDAILEQIVKLGI